MKNSLLVMSLSAALAMCSPAPDPVATLTSGGAFKVKGVKISAAGVPDWPLAAGDVISTLDSNAVIKFTDGSRVTIARQTSALIEKTQAGIRVRLQKGSMSFRLARAGKTEVSGLDLPAVPRTEGGLTVNGTNAWFFPAAGDPAAAVNPATPVVITPFNLGYLDSLRNTPDSGTPPVAPPPVTQNPGDPLPQISATHP
jgi:hypothetical protein